MSFERERYRQKAMKLPFRDLTCLDTPAMVGYVVTDSSRIAVGSFLNVNPLTITGAEGEGATGTLSTNASQVVPVYLLGPQVAAQGSHLICYHVGHRWVAAMGGYSRDQVNVPTCPCASSPSTLYMTSSDHVANGGMFQDATFVYGPTPAWGLPLFLGNSSYLSTKTYLDASTNDLFYYYLSCSANYYILTRVYEHSYFGQPRGSALRDGLRYKWLMGFPGNTCSPFALTNGNVFIGGDNSCKVTIT